MNTQTEMLRRDQAALLAELEAAGAVVKGKAIRCPFHDDKHPSASIHQGKDGVERFVCHAGSCGFSGDIFDVRARAQGRPVAEVLKEAGGDGGQAEGAAGGAHAGRMEGRDRGEA